MIRWEPEYEVPTSQQVTWLTERVADYPLLAKLIRHWQTNGRFLIHSEKAISEFARLRRLGETDEFVRHLCHYIGMRLSPKPLPASPCGEIMVAQNHTMEERDE